MPSEYVQRQIYGMYWFERDALRLGHRHARRQPHVRDRLPPRHQPLTGPGVAFAEPTAVMERSLAGVSDEIAGKVLQHTATNLYHLEPPVRG